MAWFVLDARDNQQVTFSFCPYMGRVGKFDTKIFKTCGGTLKQYFNYHIWYLTYVCVSYMVCYVLASETQCIDQDSRRLL